VAGEAWIEQKVVFEETDSGFIFKGRLSKAFYEYGYFDSCQGDSGGPALGTFIDKVKDSLFK